MKRMKAGAAAKAGRKKTGETDEKKPDRLGVMVGAVATVLAAVVTGAFALLGQGKEESASAQPKQGPPKELVQWEGAYVIESGVSFSVGTGTGVPPKDEVSEHDDEDSPAGDFRLWKEAAPRPQLAAQSYGVGALNLTAVGGGRLTRWVFDGKPGRDDCAGLLDRDYRTVVQDVEKGDVLCAVAFSKHILRIEVTDDSIDEVKTRLTVWEPRVAVSRSPMATSPTSFTD
ncbi:hypothetical protein AB0K40_19995 [Nonomuraea bangladeshensis]|uniref:Class F sortase n=1 Tax=Nonomuraea bangladeshensis TaxID=404385 RepID=A0ABV3H5K1_9ACTN